MKITSITISAKVQDANNQTLTFTAPSLPKEKKEDTIYTITFKDADGDLESTPPIIITQTGVLNDNNGKWKNEYNKLSGRWTDYEAKRTRFYPVMDYHRTESQTLLAENRYYYWSFSCACDIDF